jgi:hypothetical protein
MILAVVEVVIEPPGTPWWVPWISVAGAISLFLVGFLAAPWGKAREALFLEQRHTRRLLRTAARTSMDQLSKIQFQKFQLGHRHAVHKAMKKLQDTTRDFGSKASAKDEAAAEVLLLQMKHVWETEDVVEYAEAKAATYPLYLDLMRPVRRWRNRRKSLRLRQPVIRRKDFTAPLQATAPAQPLEAINASAGVDQQHQ